MTGMSGMPLEGLVAYADVYCRMDGSTRRSLCLLNVEFLFWMGYPCNVELKNPVGLLHVEYSFWKSL